MCKSGSGSPKAKRQISNLISTERNYNITKLTAFVNEDEAKLLPEQRSAYDKIISSVREKKTKEFSVSVLLMTQGKHL